METFPAGSCAFDGFPDFCVYARCLVQNHENVFSVETLKPYAFVLLGDAGRESERVTFRAKL